MTCIVWLASWTAGAQSADEWVAKGKRALAEKAFAAAIADFEAALVQDRANLAAHLELALTLEFQSRKHAMEVDILPSRARREFLLVLEIDPAQKTALNHLATEAMVRATAGKEGSERESLIREASKWNHQLIQAGVADDSPYLNLGILAHLAVSKPIGDALADRETVAPDTHLIQDAVLRDRLRLAYLPRIDDGITNLKRALEISPRDLVAIGFLVALYRLRSQLAETADTFTQDAASAVFWRETESDVQKSLASSPGAAKAPKIALDAAMMTHNLKSVVRPIYPADARRRGISGEVNFSAVVGPDGRVESLELISGDRLLAEAAEAAVRKWTYKTVTMNGEPARVTTTIVVKFDLVLAP